MLETAMPPLVLKLDAQAPEPTVVAAFAGVTENGETVSTPNAKAKVRVFATRGLIEN